MDIKQAPRLHPEDPEVVDAVQVVRIGMGIKDGIDMVNARGQQLLAHIRAGVDQDGRDAAIPRDLLKQQRAAGPPVLRLVGVAAAPVVPDARHAGRRSAAKDGGDQAAQADRSILLNRRKKFAVVAAAITSGDTPLTSASIRAVSTT